MSQEEKAALGAKIASLLPFLASTLGERKYFGGESLNAVDLAVWGITTMLLANAAPMFENPALTPLKEHNERVSADEKVKSYLATASKYE